MLGPVLPVVQEAYLALGEPAPLLTLYEDRAILAVHKPAGQLFHGYTKGAPAPLVEQIKADLKVRLQKPGEVYLGVVHRLDRPVSGLALFARNSKFASRLAEQFQEHSLVKTYLALVEGVPSDQEAVLEDELSFASDEAKASSAIQKLCRLQYRCLQVHEGRSLLAIQLETGRRHQIRRQLSLRGWPILGDREHGSQSFIPGTEAMDPRFRPILLHSYSLRFQHPSSFESMELKTACPFYWKLLGETWELSESALP